jgi:uncharacterized membrane-anchored protein YitT (DUF2179 family)
MVKIGRSAVRFEIVTDHPEEISQAIIHQLHHSATLIPGKGMYLGRQTNILVCVVNRTQVAAMNTIIRSFPNTFAITSQGSAVTGNFKHFKNNGEHELDLLDNADVQAV